LKEIHFIEGKIKGRLKVTRRRRQQLLNDLQKKRGYCKPKQETLDGTLWRTRFRKGCGALGKTHKRMNEEGMACLYIKVLIYFWPQYDSLPKE
jgi:hypothetical protein